MGVYEGPSLEFGVRHRGTSGVANFIVGTRIGTINIHEEVVGAKRILDLIAPEKKIGVVQLDSDERLLSGQEEMEIAGKRGSRGRRRRSHEVKSGRWEGLFECREGFLDVSH